MFPFYVWASSTRFGQVLFQAYDKNAMQSKRKKADHGLDAALRERPPDKSVVASEDEHGRAPGQRPTSTITHKADGLGLFEAPMNVRSQSTSQASIPGDDLASESGRDSRMTLSELRAAVLEEVNRLAGQIFDSVQVFQECLSRRGKRL